MSEYRYTGPATGLTFADGREVLLFDGSIVNLPNCDEVITLTALGRLTPVKVLQGQPTKDPVVDVLLPKSDSDKKGA
ncbi:MAG: hypothetical protein VB131_01495 [Burkholderia gladioli]